MNIRQQRYKKFRLEGYSAKAAAIKAGYSKNTAINATKNIEKRCNFQELLEIEGLTDNYLAKHAKEGLEALKTQTCDIYIQQTESGKYKVAKEISFIDVPDWNVRHKYFITSLELLHKIRVKEAPQPLSSPTIKLFIQNIIQKAGIDDGTGKTLIGDTEGANRISEF